MLVRSDKLPDDYFEEDRDETHHMRYNWTLQCQVSEVEMGMRRAGLLSCLWI